MIRDEALILVNLLLDFLNGEKGVDEGDLRVQITRVLQAAYS